MNKMARLQTKETQSASQDIAPVFDNTEGDFDISKFPSTRYRGSKRKIIPWLWDSFKELDFTSALDVFGGTASTLVVLLIRDSRYARRCGEPDERAFGAALK